MQDETTCQQFPTPPPGSGGHALKLVFPPILQRLVRRLCAVSRWLCHACSLVELRCCVNVSTDGGCNDMQCGAVSHGRHRSVGFRLACNCHVTSCLLPA